MFYLSYFVGCGLFGNANAYFFHSHLFVYLKCVSKTEKNQKIIFQIASSFIFKHGIEIYNYFYYYYYLGIYVQTLCH